jgi:hypothetical protein
MYFYLKANIDKLFNLESGHYFRSLHKAVFGQVRYYRQERIGLGYIFFPNYRRLLFSLLIVGLSDNVAIQIVIILLMSEMMAILVLNSRPLNTMSDNVSESINEMIIIAICYHLIIISDYVPLYEQGVKLVCSYSLISVVSLTAVVYVLIIVIS